jgi:hypothetical protein
MKYILYETDEQVCYCTAKVLPSSLILSVLTMEAIRTSETLVLLRATNYRSAFHRYVHSYKNHTDVVSAVSYC